MIDLRAKPFYLDEEDIAWVQSTLATLSTDEKIGQIFCITDGTTDPSVLKKTVQQYHPGGFMFRPAPAKEIRRAYQVMQDASRVPMLLPSNLEAGGNGLVNEGTYYAKPLEVAATGETEMARRLGEICGREGAAVGCNWAYAPIIDIDYNWRNPITNVRTFGSDPEMVLAMARAYIQGIKDSGADMLACIKHFPGDGRDERDQHLMSTVNDMSASEWRATYGRLYKTLIDEGAETVMVGHILQPALTREFCPGIRDEDILPGSTNKYLMTDLLRGELGFNGLISTDATPMVGFTGTLTRAEAIVTAVNAGADMILFCKSTEEDFATMREAIRDRRISMSRIDAAVTRILATKAHLRLHKKQRSGQLVPCESELINLGTAHDATWAEECADKAVTLVKDNQNLLPICPAKTPRIRLTVLGENQRGAFGDFASVTVAMKEELEKAGFEVSLYDYETMEQGEIFASGVEDMKAKFDLSIVAANVATGSNNTTRRLDWITLMAANEPWYTREIPTLFVSFANPYHMVDVPFISTFVNCYCANRASVRACVQKLIGQSEFKGESPVDVWCGGIWGAKTM